MKFQKLTTLSMLLAIQFALSSCYTVPYSVEAPKGVGNTKVADSTGSAQFIKVPQIVGKLCRWKNHPCFISRNLIYRLNPEELSSDLITLPAQLNPIRYLEISQDNRLMGISNENDGATFFIETNGKFKELPLPFKLEKGFVRMAAKDGIAFVINEGAAYLWDGKTWIDKSFSKAESIFKDPSQVLIGDDGYIYMRCDRGEFGGGLGRLNTQTDVFEVISIHSPVMDMAFDKSGKLWFAERFLNQGSLFSLEGKTPKMQCGMTQRVPADKPKPVNWPFQPDAFHSMTFCDDGSVLLGTNSLGVFKYKDGKTTRLTLDWNCEKEILSILPLENDELCFSAYGKGIAVVRTKSASPNNL